MAQVRIRKDVWKLAEWDPILFWYAKAVAHMWDKPITDPTGWRYQGAMHEYNIDHTDPLTNPADPSPIPNSLKHFWNQCQHGSWFFLPWHRMYLGCFEQIIMKTVRDLGGPNDWALPYWNYSDPANSNARKLPPAFREAQMEDGTVNRLRVNERTSAANAGSDVGGDQHVDIAPCLKEPVFMSPPAGGSPSFGGPQTGFHHFAGPAGTLERVPHGSIHSRVGGSGGWMSFFSTAALDPIFWLHHCNIDRLWEVWLRRNPQNTNPTMSSWLTGVGFELHDAGGAVVSMTSSQVLDTTAAPLLYEYEDVSDPLGGLPTPLAETIRPASLEEGIVSEMVGATDAPVILRGESVTTALTVNEPSGPAALAAEMGAQRRIYLNIENITGKNYSPGYSVYLNVPPGEDPAHHTELYAGLLPMFGLSEATNPAGDHPANGLQYSLDITEVAQRLAADDAWDPGEMRVTFVPDRWGDELETAAAAPSAPVQVGRVSLHYS
jgi:tyrosinase